jgi:hypothetical protein
VCLEGSSASPDWVPNMTSDDAVELRCALAPPTLAGALTAGLVEETSDRAPALMPLRRCRSALAVTSGCSGSVPVGTQEARLVARTPSIGNGTCGRDRDDALDMMEPMVDGMVKVTSVSDSGAISCCLASGTERAIQGSLATASANRLREKSVEPAIPSQLMTMDNASSSEAGTAEPALADGFTDVCEAPPATEGPPRRERLGDDEVRESSASNSTPATSKSSLSRRSCTI